MVLIETEVLIPIEEAELPKAKLTVPKYIESPVVVAVLAVAAVPLRIPLGTVATKVLVPHVPAVLPVPYF